MDNNPRPDRNNRLRLPRGKRTVPPSGDAPQGGPGKRGPFDWPLGPSQTIALLVVLVALSAYTLMTRPAGPEVVRDTVSLSVVLDLLDSESVASADLSDVQQTIEVTVTPEAARRAYRLATADQAEARERAGLPELSDAARTARREAAPSADAVYRLEAGYPVGYREVLASRLVEDGIPLNVDPIRPEGGVGMLLRGLLPILLLMGFIFFLLRSSGALGGASKLTSTKAQVSEIPDVRFSDVAGVDEAVEDLRDVVTYLHDPERFTRFGARGPKGVLLEGPPGTGKTLIARAVAGEAGVPFFAVAGSDFVEMYVGRGAARVRDLFDKARKAGKAIVFIDEIDAVGRARNNNASGAGGEREADQTLIALLNELDGFAKTNIIVMAATNRADMLDAALLRPGRLDRRVSVPAPDRAGRERILRLHAAGKPFSDKVNLAQLAGRTMGMAGAELANILNEAAVVAAKDDNAGDEISPRHVEEAYQTVTLGRARTSAIVTERDKLITAWHEAGHAVAALVQPDASDPVTVDIIPRGPAGGVTWMEGDDDQFMTRSRALAQLNVALAGRAAEEALLGGDYTQGAGGDLQSATNLALNMVTRYGMSGSLAVYTPERYQAGGKAAELDEAVEQLLQQALVGARDIVATHREKVERLAAWLLEFEHVEADQLRTLLDEQAPPVVDVAIEDVSDEPVGIVPVGGDDVTGPSVTV